MGYSASAGESFDEMQNASKSFAEAKPYLGNTVMLEKPV